MCHINLLDDVQREILGRLSYALQKKFEHLTDDLSVRDRAGACQAFEIVLDGAGKVGERIAERVSAEIAAAKDRDAARARVVAAEADPGYADRVITLTSIFVGGERVQIAR